MQKYFVPTIISYFVKYFNIFYISLYILIFLKYFKFFMSSITDVVAEVTF